MYLERYAIVIASQNVKTSKRQNVKTSKRQNVNRSKRGKN